MMPCIFEYFRPTEFELPPVRRVLQTITIELVSLETPEWPGHPDFTVTVGDGVADRLGFDECLGLVASLIVPHREAPYLRNPEARAAWDAKYRPKPLEPWQKLLEGAA